MVNRIVKYECPNLRFAKNLVLGMPFEDNSRLSALLRRLSGDETHEPIPFVNRGTKPYGLRVNYWDHAATEAIEGGQVSFVRLDGKPVDALDFISFRKPQFVDLRGAQGDNIKHLKDSVRAYTADGYVVVGATVRIDHDWMYGTEKTKLELKDGLVTVSGRPNKELTAFLKGIKK